IRILEHNELPQRRHPRLRVLQRERVEAPPDLLCFCTDTATTEIYTLSLHDALPISPHCRVSFCRAAYGVSCRARALEGALRPRRSEEHTSELQSRSDLVCRLLLEKKKMQHLSAAIQPIPREIIFVDTGPLCWQINMP